MDVDDREGSQRRTGRTGRDVSAPLVWGCLPCEVYCQCEQSIKQ